MANRTVIVDNNTWNNTHIATVGRAMASPEHQAWQIYRDLDVKYVLVVFGGFVGYAWQLHCCCAQNGNLYLLLAVQFTAVVSTGAVHCAMLHHAYLHAVCRCFC